MLLQELNSAQNNKDIIISSFMKAKDLKTKRITYISNEGYGSGVNIYIALKNNEFSALDTFLGLWIKNTIWEEELDDFDYSYEACEGVFENLFIDIALGYELRELKENEGALSLAKAIKNELKNIQKENITVEDLDNVEFLDVSGIYVNKKYTTKNPIIIKKDDEIINGVELFASDIMGSYAEMFLESKERYIYFF